MQDSANKSSIIGWAHQAIPSSLQQAYRRTCLLLNLSHQIEFHWFAARVSYIHEWARSTTSWLTHYHHNSIIHHRVTTGVPIALKSQDIMRSMGDIMVGELTKEVGLAYLLFAAVAFDAHHQLTRSPRRKESLEHPVNLCPRRDWLVIN